MKNLSLTVFLLLLFLLNSCQKNETSDLLLSGDIESLEQIANKLNDESLTSEQIASVENELKWLSPIQKEQLYSLLRKKNIALLEASGIDRSIEKQLLPKVDELCKKMNEQSVKKFNLPFWDLSVAQRNTITDLVDTDNFFNWDNKLPSSGKTEEVTACPIESFPFTSTYKIPTYYYSAYQVTDVANSTGDWICDNKVWYNATGVNKWYSTSTGLKNALVGAYSGNIGTQVSSSKRRFIVGISIWAYGYYSGSLLSYLKLCQS